MARHCDGADLPFLTIHSLQKSLKTSRLTGTPDRCYRIHMTEEQTTDRRNFLVMAIYGLGALIGAALAVPATVYLLWPPRPKKQEWVEAGSMAPLQPKVPEEMVFRRNRADGWKITSEKATAWVVKMSQKDIIAFAPQCPHLGCAY